MGEIFTNLPIQNKLRSASSQMERNKGIFGQRQTSFSSTEESYLSKAFEKAIAEKAYQGLANDLSFLRRKEMSFDSANNISTNKFIDHERKLQANPEIKAIESNIAENQSKIKEKQQALNGKAMSESSYQRSLMISESLRLEIGQLQSAEMSILGDISSIRATLAQVKSGNLSLSSLQVNITGSASTTSIDTSKLISTDTSSAAILGGQQVSNDKLLQSLFAESAKANAEACKIQEEIENQIKRELIGMLENMLSEKENQLNSTRSQISQKEKQLNENQKQIDSYGSNGSEITYRETLEAEIEQLIKETESLLRERVNKDPEMVRFYGFQSFFSNFLKGNGETGTGVSSDITRKENDFEDISEKYKEKSSESESYENILNIESFLRNEAKLNLGNSRNKTEEFRKLFWESRNRQAS